MPTDSPLDRIRIASPCPTSWESMKGDDRVRYCEGCQKNVYNLSSLPRTEAEDLLRSREGKLCALIYRRRDGTVLTTDCPVGLQRVRERIALRFAAVAAAMMTLFGLDAFVSRPKEPPAPRVSLTSGNPTPRPHQPVLDKETEAALRSLGYVSDSPP